MKKFLYYFTWVFWVFAMFVCLNIMLLNLGIATKYTEAVLIFLFKRFD